MECAVSTVIVIDVFLTPKVVHCVPCQRCMSRVPRRLDAHCLSVWDPAGPEPIRSSSCSGALQKRGDLRSLIGMPF